MTRKLVAAMRRANRLMRPAKLAEATRTAQTNLAAMMLKAAFAPLVALKPNVSKPAKATGSKPARSLGTVIKQLQAVKLGKSSAARKTTQPENAARLPANAQYLSLTHRSRHGSRNYWIYLPAGQPTRPNGLILMLHGCGQTPEDFALGTHMNVHAEKHGYAIVYPAQTSTENGASCWNWFKPVNQVRDGGEPAQLASLTRKLMKDYGLGRDKVFVAGLSAGGAMAAILIDIYPDVFSAAGIHSGLARGSARDVMSAMSAMRSGGSPQIQMPHGSSRTLPVRRIIFHGDADDTVHPSNALNIVSGAIGDSAKPIRVTKRSVRGSDYTLSEFAGPEGRIALELWTLKGVGHAWSGGRAVGSYTERNGPDASAQMIRFFLAGVPKAG